MANGSLFSGAARGRRRTPHREGPAKSRIDTVVEAAVARQELARVLEPRHTLQSDSTRSPTCPAEEASAPASAPTPGRAAEETAGFPPHAEQRGADQAGHRTLQVFLGETVGASGVFPKRRPK